MAGVVRPQVWTFAMCLHCEAVFRIFPSVFREKGKGKFCSKRCWSEFTRGQPHKSYTRLYGIWCHLKTRCNCETAGAYHWYGGRGIRVCEEWSKSFEAFERWAMANGYSDKLELDRKDVNGDYEPGNCRWANRFQQMQNRRKPAGAASSKWKGVSWCANVSKWRVQIVVMRKNVHGGLFTDERQAAKQYDRLAVTHFGEFANLNFPPKGRGRHRSIRRVDSCG